MRLLEGIRRLGTDDLWFAVTEQGRVIEIVDTLGRVIPPPYDFDWVAVGVVGVEEDPSLADKVRDFITAYYEKIWPLRREGATMEVPCPFCRAEDFTIYLN